MSKRAEEKVNCFEGGCPSVSLSLHCTLAGGVGDPEVVPFWNSLIIKILCDKSNLFIYFQEQYFVRHSGTAFLRFTVATSPCTLHLCILAVSSAIVQVLCRRRRSTSDWCTYSVCCPCLSSSLPRSHICPGRHDGVDCEVKTGIQQSAKILRCTATGHWSFELSSGDNKLYCGDQKYNYFVSYLFLHHNSSDKSRHPDRTTMSGVQLLQLDGGGWPGQITLHRTSTGRKKGSTGESKDVNVSPMSRKFLVVPRAEDLPAFQVRLPVSHWPNTLHSCRVSFALCRREWCLSIYLKGRRGNEWINK